jgi:hypothetical protein
MLKFVNFNFSKLQPKLLEQCTAPEHHIARLHKSAYSKGKAIPLQAWTVPQGERLRLPHFQTIGT